jgi:chaperone required for assembly of F1-ATPase
MHETQRTEVVHVRATAEQLIGWAEKARIEGHPRPATRLVNRAMDWHSLTDEQMDRAADVLVWADEADPISAEAGDTDG